MNVEVREDGMLAGQSLGEGFVTGGGGPAAPFAGTIAFTTPTKPGGAVVFFERSSADGQASCGRRWCGWRFSRIGQ